MLTSSITPFLLDEHFEIIEERPCYRVLKFESDLLFERLFLQFTKFACKNFYSNMNRSIFVSAKFIPTKKIRVKENFYEPKV